MWPVNVSIPNQIVTVACAVSTWQLHIGKLTRNNGEIRIHIHNWIFGVGDLQRQLPLSLTGCRYLFLETLRTSAYKLKPHDVGKFRELSLDRQRRKCFR